MSSFAYPDNTKNAHPQKTNTHAIPSKKRPTKKKNFMMNIKEHKIKKMKAKDTTNANKM